MSSSRANIQTVDQAESSIGRTAKSTFASLAKTLGLSQLRDSFFQNIIYILLMIIIFIGILVYIQMVGPAGNDPLNSPPTREIKKVEIKKIVEGFELQNDSTSSIARAAFTLEEFNNNNHNNHNNNNHNEVDLHLAHSGHNEEDNGHSKIPKKRK